jgi:hypothetical protein
VQSARLESGVELARYHHTIAAVVALAAKDYDTLGGERGEFFGEQLHHAMAGIFHEDDDRGCPFRWCGGRLRAFGRRSGLSRAPRHQNGHIVSQFGGRTAPLFRRLR